ncbi:IbrB-like domain-containing protein [Vibrio owensii]|uniref:Partitioning protein ParB n=1 Tax=Vibrio owensii CAIM 1854 = LMG 25443 TaxID=1229493 RepID=A0A0C1VS57_9VIBR|nr:ParB/RepB/Spo0J family partition protein [Vibrio owensii]KIF52728.1 partitioning protein ParB [Vibrio owensii CAIM 1854 = LMG 25443]
MEIDNTLGLLDTLQNTLRDFNVKKASLTERVSLFNLLSECAEKIVPFTHPVLSVRLVEHQKVVDNDYNPNKVAPPEFKLLRHSILKDGLTMPVVTGRQRDCDDLVIIDGYHRSRLIKHDEHIRASLGGYMPVVVLDKSLDERMSSSVRHNMARGAHQVELTAQLVMKLKCLDWSNDDIGRELGMDSDEVLRMQQVTGLAAAFKDDSFSSAWE